MEYEKYKTKPESTRKFLVQQVEEQSDLCDFVVKMGEWEKKFHRCVLIASPFFDHALKNNFLEKQTGKIEMTTGTAFTLEMAIMFLYGKKPTFTEENIEHMISLAEFLLIPNLKSACVSWLRTVTITEENCMHFLEISNTYEFEIPRCNEYLMGHLPEMLRHAKMVKLPKDSIKLLFSDRKLSYVAMDDKVNFLLKWVKCQPATQEKSVKELFEIIDFHEVSKAVLDELKANQNLCDEINLEQILCQVDNETLDSHPVLMMKGECDTEAFWCFDLVREKWFRLESKVFAHISMLLFQNMDILGTGNSKSEVCFTCTQLAAVLNINLDTDTCKTYQLVHSDNENEFKELDGLQMNGNMYIAYVNEQIRKQIYEMDSQSSELMNHLSFMQMMALDGHVVNNLITRNVLTNISTLHIGYQSGDTIEMSPLLAFKDDEIINICINKTFSVAIIFQSREVVTIFNLSDYTVETMQLKTTYGDTLIQNNDGFIIYDDERCICLTRLIRPSLSSKFKTTVISFSKTYTLNFMDKYIFCEHSWYRYYQKSFSEPFLFETATHSEVMSQCSFEGITWKQLPLPRDESKCHKGTIKDRLYHINLPKSKLRCDIECPHCNISAGGTSVSSESVEYESDGNLYEDSYTLDEDEIWPLVDNDNNGWYISSDSD